MSFISRKWRFRALAFMALGYVMMSVGIALTSMEPPAKLVIFGVLTAILGYSIFVVGVEKEVIAK